MSISEKDQAIYKLTDHMLTSVLEKTAEAMLWHEAEFEPFLCPLMLSESIRQKVIDLVVKHLNESYARGISRICFTFDKDAKLAGFVFFTHIDKKRVFIDFIYTFESYRMQGVMSSLLNELGDEFEFVLVSSELSGYFSKREGFYSVGYTPGHSPVFTNFEPEGSKIGVIRLPEVLVNKIYGVLSHG
ncbi:GNAT family N-acetyltransferase [Thiomicrorhabdus sediminis]|uniref:GNAT family N-acetyltransferase n=1 Tax=Thiomicrorhabdus sediminis TaxID=2580412 RepID=A0A4P9K7E0_9GAMM|nr:GNAT family N-acetyltransferase [Thiomicrorhabdus sediminis]QCU90256.1 GNAT family N-acetyltransferase [Thiomicrorhabdus sediminis]